MPQIPAYQNPLIQKPWFNQAKPKEKKPTLQKNCDLCGTPLGEKYWVGLTHPEIKLGAITCDKRKCYKWLDADHRKRHTRIIE
jgi:hypothetical protein